jgi:hypothetical protein
MHLHATPTAAEEAARRAGAEARLRHHEHRELRSLELAVKAEDDALALLFEARADQAYLDAQAVASEHEITPDFMRPMP